MFFLMSAISWVPLIRKPALPREAGQPAVCSTHGAAARGGARGWLGTQGTSPGIPVSSETCGGMDAAVQAMTWWYHAAGF